jgi:hypothetical protein
MTDDTIPKPTNMQLAAWAYRLNPDSRRLTVLQDLINRWTTFKAGQNDPYDTEYCDFKIDYFKAQKSALKREIQAKNATSIEDLARVAAEHSADLDEVTANCARIYNAEQADRLIGKRPLQLPSV